MTSIDKLADAAESAISSMRSLYEDDISDKDSEISDLERRCEILKEELDDALSEIDDLKEQLASLEEVSNQNIEHLETKLKFTNLL